MNSETLLSDMNECDSRSIAYQVALLTGPPFPEFPALRVIDLSPERRALLGRTIGYVLDESNRRGRYLSDSDAYMIALDMFGCVCPHIIGGDAEAYRGTIRFTCRHCCAVVIQPFEFPSSWLRPIAVASVI